MDLQKLATTLRVLSADMVERAKSGHPGASLGMADIATVLWTKFLRFDALNPDWPNRDRVIFSNGHASSLAYAMLYMMGMKDVELDDLKNFRRFNSRTPGHPERGVTNGIDFSTGPLGQGLAGAVGMAMAERILNQRLGDDVINHKTYCFVGDGCLMEGISEEAISLAGLWKLKNLVVLWDDNNITIDGQTEIATQTDMQVRFMANNWTVLTCDGHDFESIEKALTFAQRSKKPVLIDCKTTIGFGAPTKAGKSCVHGAPLGAEELQALKQNLNWDLPPFEVPQDILDESRQVGLRHHVDFEKWQSTLPANFEQVWQGETYCSLANMKAEYLKNPQPIATRKASQNALETLLTQIPNLIGGSADLGASNLTKTKVSQDIMPSKYQGNYLNYGVRELAMSGIANGLAAHGGLIPYTSTFFVFSDYMKPAIRLGALMGLKQLYVLTHDSIGVGQDGPTHQPIEQLVSLRATPNLKVFRPADAIEVAESYETAMEINGPSALVLSRQNLPCLRESADENLTQKGAYVVRDVKGKRKLTLIATGSEVSLALQVAEKLPQTAVVSMPCWELFAKQSPEYQQSVLGDAPRVSIEAASTFGWERWTGSDGLNIGLDTFGQSASGEELFEHFGFSVEKIIERIEQWRQK
jgi:transketolase